MKPHPQAAEESLMKRISKFLGSSIALCVLTSSTPAHAASWHNPNGGSFSDPSNWLGNVVPGTSDMVIFNTGTNPYAVTFDQPETNASVFLSNNVTFDLSGQTYTLTNFSGTGNATIANGSFAAQQFVQSGTTTFENGFLTIGTYSTAGTTNISDANVTMNKYEVTGALDLTNSSLQIQTASGGSAITITNSSLNIATGELAGPITLNSGSIAGNQLTTSGLITVDAGTMNVSGPWLATGAISINGGTVTAANLTVQNNLSLNGGTLDITGSISVAPIPLTFTIGTLIVPSATSLKGITIDYTPPGDLIGKATYAKITTPTDYEITFTWYGDANGDGVVNSADLALMAPIGTPNATWSMGDFNGNGVIDADDYSLFALGSTYGAANISTMLPEPALAIMGLGAVAVLRRRRSAVSF